MQWYTALVLMVDASLLFMFWAKAPHPMSAASEWFDPSSDSYIGSELFTAVKVLIMASGLGAIANPFNRWVLLHHSVVETLRVALFILLLKRLSEPKNVHTISLTLMGLNAIIHWRNWYGTWDQLVKNATEKNP